MVTETQAEAAVAAATITNAPLPLSVATIIKQHSTPFYISPTTLFNNRRLKNKRRKWAAAAAAAAAAAQKNNNKKTEIQPTLTINLLSSSDDDEDQNIEMKRNSHFTTNEQNQIRIVHAQHISSLEPLRQKTLRLKPVLVQAISLNEPPPLVPLSNRTSTVRTTTTTTNARMQDQFAIRNLPQLILPNTLLHTQNIQCDTKIRRRKHNKPAPIILNEESIVLSDDSDTTDIPNQYNNNNNNKSPVLPLLPELTLTAINNCNNNTNNKSPIAIEEEVTVSLVPRVKNNSHIIINEEAQNQKIIANNVAFPMLPDETTVHTVIANRTYELSLAKLREGLAQGEQSSPCVQPTIATSSSQNTPIALKLSSDLSISLISDDDDDVEQDNSQFLNNNERARLSAELLRRQQPQLSVQQVCLPASCSSVNKQPPKRRKLS